MISDLIIIDNVFENVQEIIEQFNKTEMFNRLENEESYLEQWCGYRSHNLYKYNPELIQKSINTILKKTLNSKNYNNHSFEWKGDAVFHLLEDSPKQNDSWFHKDSVTMACIVYLNEDAQKNSGTEIIINDEKKIVENKFNRAVIYNARLMHAAQGGFGRGRNSRLTLNIFIDELTINIR